MKNNAREPGHSHICPFGRCATPWCGLPIQLASSFKAQNVKQAEEMAIALAIVDPQTTTVLSDSKSAMLAYATNQVNPNTESAV